MVFEYYLTQLDRKIKVKVKLTHAGTKGEWR
jgi:hypothetical protein